VQLLFLFDISLHTYYGMKSKIIHLNIDMM